MKNILALILTAVFAFGIEQDFLEPEEALKTSFVEEQDRIVFNIKLGEKIYLYDDKLKIFMTKPQKVELTNKITIPKPVPYQEFIVHFVDQKLVIPKKLLEDIQISDSYEIEVQFQGCSKAGLCYAPMSESYTFSKVANKKDVVKENKSLDEPLTETDAITNTLASGNILLILGTFFGLGLLLSLTPCIFPMIPILSSIIVKAGNNQELTASRGFFLSLIYVFSMSLAYTVAGVLAGLFGANLQVALQNPYVLVVFSLIFVALAFSMFGYFKLELPQSIQSKIHNTTEGKEKQGVMGIAIMGFLSALIVGPCVAPPLAGALVYIGQTGDALLGGLALFVLSFGMGVPLLLIGLGAGKFIPRPGGWMDSVSKIFGIVMLGVAVWMLDRVIGDYTIYLTAFLLLGTALYLQLYKHIIIRLIVSILFIYGAVLFVGALSGTNSILRPLEKFTAVQNVLGESSTNKKLIWAKVKNLDELDAAIKASTKPVMLDFYADWCISCKELEEITFKDPAVIEFLAGVTLLKADVTKNSEDDKAMQKKYGIFGPPGLIFWDTNNKEIKKAKIIGYKNPEDFLTIVKKSFK